MSVTKLELVVHPMCPYAQRALYTLAFKGIQADIIHVNVAEPEPWFLELNPLGEVPALRVIRDEHTDKLTESLNISEYFDSFPGPALYPINSDGSVNYLEKGQIDVFIKLFVSEFGSALWGAYFQRTPEGDKNFIDLLLKLNTLLSNGKYMANEILGRNEFTFADMMAFPFVERFIVLRELNQEAWDTANPTEVVEWFNRLNQESWAQAHRVPEHRLKNLLKRSRETGGYKGLELPLSVYD